MSESEFTSKPLPRYIILNNLLGHSVSKMGIAMLPTL